MIIFVYHDSVKDIDEDYEYDGVVTVAEAMMLKEKSGLGFRKIFEALDDGDPHSVVAWRWMLARRAGKAVTWEDMLKTNITDYKGVKPQPQPEFPADESVGEPENPTEGSPTSSTSGTIPSFDTEATT